MKKLPDISNIINKVLNFTKRYAVLIVFLIMSSIYGFLAYRINSLTQAEPSDEAVAAKLQNVARPRIDQASIDKMLKLEQENIEVKTLFEQARNNPFNE